MKSNNNIPSTLVDDLGRSITEHISRAAIIKTVIYVIVAAAAAALLFAGSIASPAWVPAALGTVATVCIVMAVVTCFGSKRELRYNGTRLRGYEIYFTNPSVSEITRLLREHDREGLLRAVNNTDNGLRLNVAISDDGSLMRYRMYKYVPFEYKPEGATVELDSATAEFVKTL